MRKSKKIQEEDKGLYRRPNSSIWWLRYSDAGKQIRISLETESKAEAIQKAAVERNKGYSERKTPKTTKTPWADEVQRYIKEKLAGANNCRKMRPRTAALARQALLAVPKILGVSSTKEITTDHLTAYYKHWQTPGETRDQRKPKVYKRKFKNLRVVEENPKPIRKGSECTARTMTAYLQGFLGHIGSLPGRVKFQKGIQREKREVTVDQNEIKRLISACKRDDLLFVLLMGFYQGMRRSEIVYCRPQWIDLVGGKINIPAKEIQSLADKTQRLWQTKNGKARAIPLAPPVREYLQARPELLTKSRLFILHPETCSNPLRWDPRVPFEKHVEHLDGVTLHTMRHTFISHLANHGSYSATQISAWSGDTLQVIESNYFHASAPSGGLDAAFETPSQRTAKNGASAEQMAEAMVKIQERKQREESRQKALGEINVWKRKLQNAKDMEFQTFEIRKIEEKLKEISLEYNREYESENR